MEPNLREWLLPLAQRVGRIYDYKTERAFEKAVQVNVHRLLETTIPGFHWKDNALRHSYGSYLYGRERNLDYVRACMGNTEEMMMGYYNNPKTEARGRARFSLCRARRHDRPHGQPNRQRVKVNRILSESCQTPEVGWPTYRVSAVGSSPTAGTL